jgi:hypothetical protein
MNADWLTWVALTLLAAESAAIVRIHSRRFCRCEDCHR